MSTSRSGLFVGLMAVVMGPMAQSVSADVSDLVKRIPPGANSIAYINVESVLKSKLGVKEGWRDKLKDSYASKPLIVPPAAKQVLLASWIEPNGMNSMWEVSLIETSTSISMERIAKDEKGFVESIGDKLAAWTPMNAYFVRLDTKLLGVVSPSDRQFTARWAARGAGGADSVSPYLRAAVAKIDPKTDYMFVLDLDDMVSEKHVRRRLAMDEIACLAGKEIDVNKISDVLASVKGLKLAVQVDDDVSGDCIVEFGKPVAALAPYAKPLLMEMLDKSGADIGDFNDWKDTSKGSTIQLSGKLSVDGFARLLSVVDPPCPQCTDEDSAGSNNKDKSAVPPSPEVIAEASRKYYKSVAEIIDGISKQVNTSNSLNKGAAFIARDARRISRLPILNVDPDLVQWGSATSTRLLQVATSLGVGGFTARASTSRIEETQVTTGMNDYSYGVVKTNPNDDINRRNANRQRIAASAEARANVLKEVTQVLQDIETTRGAIRAAMTAKHKVEF